MASIDEAYLDMTGTARLHGPPLQRRAQIASADERRDPAELLGRHRHPRG